MNSTIDQNEKPIVDSVADFLKTLTPEGQKAFWIFVLGAKFGTATGTLDEQAS